MTSRFRIIAARALAGAFIATFAWAAAAQGTARRTESPQNSTLGGTPKAEASTAGTPRIEFKRLDHDFGAAASGETLKTQFAFTNVGDGVLHIRRVSGG